MLPTKIDMHRLGECIQRSLECEYGRPVDFVIVIAEDARPNELDVMTNVFFSSSYSPLDPILSMVTAAPVPHDSFMVSVAGRA